MPDTLELMLYNLFRTTLVTLIDLNENIEISQGHVQDEDKII